MSVLNPLARELSVKIVYYGPGLSGKTTSLQCVHDGVNPERRGKMVSLATRTDRTLFFDFLPLQIERVGGLAVRLQLYTVPGQVFYGATRKLVLKNADGVVFVADSQPGCRDSNVESLADLGQNMHEHGMDPDAIPRVIQYNKRDLPDVMSLSEMARDLNPKGWPEFPTDASAGDGVLDALRAITRLVVKRLVKQHRAAENMALSREFPAPDPEEGLAAQVSAAVRSAPPDALARSRQPSEGGTSQTQVTLPPAGVSAVAGGGGATRSAPATKTGAASVFSGSASAPAAMERASEPTGGAPARGEPTHGARPVADGPDFEDDGSHLAPTGRPHGEADATRGGVSFARLWPERAQRHILEIERYIAADNHGAAVERCNALLAQLLYSLPGPRTAGDLGVRATLLGLDGQQYLRVCRLDSTPEEALTHGDALLALHLLVSAQLKCRDLDD